MLPVLTRILFAILTTAHGAELEPRFYRLTAPGQSRAEASYALGTIHVQVHLEEFPTLVPDTLAHANILMTEVALTADQVRDFRTNPYTVAEQFYDFVGTGPGLSPAAKTTLGQLGVPEEFMTHLSTYDCGVFDLIRQIRQPQPPLDLELMEAAQLNKVPVVGLDTPSLRQARIASELDGACSLNLALSIFPVEEIVRQLEDVGATVRDYRSGIPMNAYLDPKLLIDRNKAWLPRILEQTRKGRAFLAVGEGHLEGRDGIFELLKQKGYKVETVFKRAQSPEAPARTPRLVRQ